MNKTDELRSPWSCRYGAGDRAQTHKHMNHEEVVISAVEKEKSLMKETAL